MSTPRQTRRGQRIRDTRTILRGVRDALWDPGVRLLLAMVVSFVLVGAVVFSLLEGWGAVDAIFFCVVTIATVGYGDIVPQTDAGKLFTVVYIAGGIGLFVALASAIADHVIQRAREDLGLDKTRDDPDP